MNKFASIRPAIVEDFPAIIDTWEKSVRATHHFLPEIYLQEIKALLPGILPQVQLFIYSEDVGKVEGFLGIAGQKIEMLFIHPDKRGKGLGRFMTSYAIEEFKAYEVEVNEQNEQAVGFYQKVGFVTVGRTDLDGLGRPYPLLQMKLAVTCK